MQRNAAKTIGIIHGWSHEAIKVDRQTKGGATENVERSWKCSMHASNSGGQIQILLLVFRR